MLTLGFDTSNYATSLAVFDTVAGEVVCDTKQLLPVSHGRMGLRQSEALFHHTVLLPKMLKQMAAKVPLTQVQAVGVSVAPRPVEGSYMPCFLAGNSAAQAFSAASDLELVKTTHQQGHVAAALFAAGGAALFAGQALVFHVSGGTTDLLLTDPDGSVHRLAGSTDLFAGQAVDRLGARLGFAFPSGRQVSLLATTCTQEIRPWFCVKDGQCSFSGLENLCDQLLAKGKDPAFVCRYCLVSIAETLCRMAYVALEEHPSLPLVFAGGVMSSAVISDYVTKRLPKAKFVSEKFASDNAIGVAIITAREVGMWPNTSA